MAVEKIRKETIVDMPFLSALTKFPVACRCNAIEYVLDLSLRQC